MTNSPDNRFLKTYLNNSVPGAENTVPGDFCVKKL